MFHPCHWLCHLKEQPQTTLVTRALLVYYNNWYPLLANIPNVNVPRVLIDDQQELKWIHSFKNKNKKELDTVRRIRFLLSVSMYWIRSLL
jgi:hypothetical protein